jgi:hypothetical protein
VLFTLNTYGQSKADSLNTQVDTIKNKIIELKEVIIKAIPIPVKMKGDTVSYNAKAFKTRVNSTVEDLLKKMPGLSVDDQGRVTFQGKAIEKIYIDGKDYYLNDPRLITQNLTADMIDRIDVFDQQSKQSRLTGVKDVNPEKALNLKLKKGVKLDFTGKVNAGYGTRDGYSAGAKGTSFVKDGAVIGSVSSNNINDLTEEFQLPFSTYGRSSSDKAALQYSAPWGKKLRANLEYNGGDKRVDNENASSNRQSFLSDSTQLQSRNSEHAMKHWDHNLSGIWELAIDSSTNINLQSSAGVFSGNNKSNDTLQSVTVPSKGLPYTGSLGGTNNTSHSRQLGISNALRYDQKLKNRTLSFNLNQDYSRDDQQGFFNSILRLYDPNGAMIQTERTDQQFSQANYHKEYKAGFSDAEQLKPGHFLNASYGYQQLYERQDKESFDYNSQTGKYDLPDTLTTDNFSNTTAKHQAGLSYISNSPKVNYSFGAAFEHSVLSNSDSYRNIKFSRGFSAILPAASFSYNSFNKIGTQNYSAEYTESSQQPYSIQLQPVTDNRNPMQLVTGNPDLKQAINHTLALRYSCFKVKTLQNFSFELRAVYEQHSIITTTDILAGGVQKVSYINRDGKYSMTANTNYELPVGRENKGKLRLTVESQYEHSPAILNGQEIVLRAFSNRQKTEFRYKLKKLEIGAEASLSYQVARYSQGTELNSSGLIQNYKMAASYDLPFNLLLKSDYSLQLIGTQGGLPANKILVWNASLLKNVLKSGRGEFKLSAFDLLNSNKGFYQRIGAGYIQQTTSNVLGRLFLVSFIYHIRTVPPDHNAG